MINLELIFDTSKVKADFNKLAEAFRDNGLNLCQHGETTLYIINSGLNLSFSCALIFNEDENIQEEGRYFELELSDRLNEESFNRILITFIRLSVRMDFRLMHYGTEIDERNYKTHDFSKFDEKSAKEFYLGSTASKYPPKGSIDKSKIPRALEHEGSVCIIVCSHCHTIMEGARANAEALSRAAGIPCPNDFTGKYFEATACPVCMAEEPENVKVELKSFDDDEKDEGGKTVYFNPLEALGFRELKADEDLTSDEEGEGNQDIN